MGCCELMSAFTREEHEQGLAVFVARNHRPRFVTALEDPKLRRKLRHKLAHFAWLDERYTDVVPTPEPAALATSLRAEGAPATCVLVAEDDVLDGRELPLEEALRRVLHDFHGALISIVPGRLAVFSDEAPNKTITILRRAATK
jgi:hypothetical protein